MSGGESMGCVGRGRLEDKSYNLECMYCMWREERKRYFHYHFMTRIDNNIMACWMAIYDALLRWSNVNDGNGVLSTESFPRGRDSPVASDARCIEQV